jgi:hypothetical protein
MMNDEHLKILMQGVDNWNQWREDNPDMEPDLSEADLSAMDLAGANLAGANLTGTNLYKSMLNDSDLTAANLTDTNLTEAQLVNANLTKGYLFLTWLQGANLYGANLSEAHLIEADIIGVNFTNAKLRSADFTDSDFGWCILGNVELKDVSGLESTDHFGPSTIGIDTIYQSGGKIPKEFLVGAGIPESFIELIPAFISESKELYSCFISYSTKDEEFAKHLYSDLKENGVRCWFAPEDIKGGRKIHEQNLMPSAIMISCFSCFPKTA